MGTEYAKRKIWDGEFRSGKWDYLRENDLKDPATLIVEKYVCNGSVLDLGCGTGVTGFEIDLDKYALYTGIDISAEAINRAVSATKEERKRKNEYGVSDILKYQPRNMYNVILFKETIYYLPFHTVEKTLRRYHSYLLPGGVFIVRLCDAKRYRYIVKLIRTNFTIKETFIDKTTIIFVFR